MPDEEKKLTNFWNERDVKSFQGFQVNKLQGVIVGFFFQNMFRDLFKTRSLF